MLILHLEWTPSRLDNLWLVQSSCFAWTRLEVHSEVPIQKSSGAWPYMAMLLGKRNKCALSVYPPPPS